MDNFDFRTINTKGLSEIAPHREKIDMLSSVVEITDKESIPIIGQILMDANTLTRLDIIVNHFWGISDELDILMKYNDIDDPFSVPTGKIIYIPDRFTLESRIVIRKLEEPLSNSITKSNKINKLKFGTDSNIKTIKETAAQKRSILIGRGNGPRVTVPGVIKF